MIVQVNVVLNRTVFDSDYIMFTRTIMLNLLTKYLLTFAVYCFLTKLHEHHDKSNLFFYTRTRGSYILGGRGRGL